MLGRQKLFSQLALALVQKEHFNDWVKVKASVFDSDPQGSALLSGSEFETDPDLDRGGQERTTKKKKKETCFKVLF